MNIETKGGSKLSAPGCKFVAGAAADAEADFFFASATGFSLVDLAVNKSGGRAAGVWADGGAVLVLRGDFVPPGVSAAFIACSNTSPCAPVSPGVFRADGSVGASSVASKFSMAGIGVGEVGGGRVHHFLHPLREHGGALRLLRS